MKSEDISPGSNVPVVEWRQRALDELQAIYQYIHQQSPQNADHVVNTLLDLGESLRHFPYKFPREPSLNQEHIRFATKWHYKIIYQVVNHQRLLILRVFCTKQDADKLKDTGI